MDKGITALSGVGSARAKHFEKLGIHTIEELLRHYPRGYEDIGNIIDIADMSVSRGMKVTLFATVCGRITEKRIGGGRLLTSVPICDDSGAAVLTYFNNRFIKNSLREGVKYYFYGKITENGMPTLYNPEVYRSLPENGSLLPIYPLTSGLSQSFVRKSVAQALKITDIGESLPQELLNKYSLCGIKDAICKIHTPQSDEDIFRARRRLIFEELLYFSLGLQMMKAREKQRAAVTVSADIPQEFLNAHDFSPTAAQSRAMSEIYRDLQSGYSMHRLLQGDVGSGKTLVAGQCAYCVIRSGAQAAVMAPTEVLANQHYRYFSEKLAPLGINVSLLTSAVTAAQKREIKARIKSGEIQLIIGTHAVLQSDVEFQRLGLVITDEQHRFGVMQRTALAEKGSGAHILVMSATPIPRTLALMLWGDLELSVIDALPEGRQKTKTHLVNSGYKERLYGFIEKNIADGGQVYYVCPAVEENEESTLTAAISKKDELAKLFPKYTVGLLHGKMKPRNKDCAMRDFADGKTKILVSTTVIEVGVNVPNATLMIIDDAHRFGLSQLHQLRGRVGRGSRRSYCVLISDTSSESAKERMSFFSKTDDGFKIAEKDLSLRGPGNFFGREQHGLPQMKIADMNGDSKILKDAARCAADLLSDDTALEKHAEIRKNVSRLFDVCTLD